jgi:hypothetical protein
VKLEENVEKSVDYYMSLPYTVELKAGKVVYGASVKELPGCKASVKASESVEELWRLLKEDQRKLIEELLERGEDVPEPAVADPFWEDVPDDIGEDEVRSMLYTKGAVSFPLRILEELWLQELEDVRVAEVVSPGMPPPKAGPKLPDQTVLAREGDLRAVRLGKSLKGAWIKLDGPRTRYGYKAIEVLDQPLRTEAAIVSALTVLEASAIADFDFERLCEALLNYVEVSPGLKGKNLQEVLNRLPRRWIRERKADIDQELKPLDKRLKQLKLKKWLSSEEKSDLKELEKRLPKDSWRRERSSLFWERSIKYTAALLRYRRPDFNNHTLEQQLDLIDKHRKRVNTFLEEQRAHMRFLEYGTPTGLPTRVVERTQDQIKAAVLRDVENLSPLEIANRLEVHFDEERYHKVDWKIPEVSGLIDDGQLLLDKILSGEGGWRKRAREMKAEAERYRSLSEEGKEIETLAESMGWTVDRARSLYQTNPEMARFLVVFQPF